MTMINNPRSPQVQAAFIRAHLRMANAGLAHSRMSRRTVLDRAAEVTKTPYRNSLQGIEAAIIDLTAVIDRAKEVSHDQ